MRAIVPLRKWIERHGSSAENRRPAVGQRVHCVSAESSVDPHWRRACSERPLPVAALVMRAPEASVRTPQQRRRYTLKQDVARCGPTPGCEACVALARGAQSDEATLAMAELGSTNKDEKTLNWTQKVALRP